MEFDSIEFAAFCAAAVTVLNLVRGQRARVLAILTLSAIFLASFAATASLAIPLVGFVIVGYGAILISARVGPKSLLVLVAAVVALFVWLKQYTVVSFVPPLGFPYLLLGLSYILFRIVHLMVDVNQKAQAAPGFLDYVAYVFFFLTFVSGPIERYEDFARHTSEPRLPRSTGEIHTAFNRIVWGFFLVAVVTKITFYVFGHIEPRFYELMAVGRLSATAVVLYAAAVATFATHLYLNFVGYMEMVIGVGLLCGFRIAENFDRPYLSENFLDFWSRWHITLSNWFRFYVFNPTLKSLSERWGSPATMPYLGVIAFFVTFLVMGIWHGSSAIYVFYGLFLGFGMAANKLYQVEMVRRFGRPTYRALCARAWYRHLCRALTLAYFAIALTCVWLAPARSSAMASATGLAVGAAAFLILTLGIFVLSAGLACVQPLYDRARRAIHRLGFGIDGVSALRPVWTGVKLFVVVNIALIAGGSAPEFVYKVF
jgi:alginate O-acetyltransferase complex protein AlgI